MTDYKHIECRNDWEDWVDSQDVMIKMHISSRTPSMENKWATPIRKSVVNFIT